LITIKVVIALSISLQFQILFTRKVFIKHRAFICEYTVFRKKHPLTFSFISLLKMFRFPQNFQVMFRRKQLFHR